MFDLNGEVTLTEHDHRYWFNSADMPSTELFSVTRTLNEANLVDDEWFSELAAERGTLVHALAELYARGTLDRLTVDPALAGYLRAVEAFYQSHYPTMLWEQPQLHHIERIAFDRVRRAAGTLDFCWEHGLRRRLYDFKTSTPTPWHGLQLAAYAWLAYGHEWVAVERYGVYLKSSGRFALERFDDHSDLQIYLNALDNMNWRARHGRSDRLYGKSVYAGAAR